MSSGSKPVTTMGTWNCRGDGAIFVHAGDRADVPRRQKSLHPVRRRFEHGGDRRRHEDVGDQGREVFQPQPRRLGHRHRVGRRSGLEADGEEDHLAIRMPLGQGHGLHRRVDDAHVAPFRLHREEVLRRAGHAEHVAERAKDRFPPRGDGHGLVDHFQRRDADRAARSVDQRNLRWQHLIQREADDRVRLPAADLHDVPRPGGRPRDGRGQASGGVGVAIFVDVLHGPRSICSICSI